MQIKLRLAQPSDLQWINKKYSEIGFMQSSLEREKIAIAEVKGERVGFGRLVKIDDKVLELSGIYVYEPYRRNGVATKIVTHLLSLANPYNKVYCIAFKHLTDFYKRHGFEFCEHAKEGPLELRQKYHRCLKIYNNSVHLLAK